MSSKSNVQDRKDFDRFTKFFIYKSIQIIVQSRLGEKIKTRSKPFSSGADWFNLAITDNNEVHSEAKKCLSGQTSTLSQNVCVEISLRTSDGDTMVLEIWYISLDTNNCDINAGVSQQSYYRMGVALKSLLSVSRVTPAYKLSRRQGSCAGDYVICYRIYLGDPQFYILGDGHQKSKVGSVPTPYGKISVSLTYRTKLLISPQNAAKDAPFEVKDDHFKQDTSPVRPTTPKPCSQGYRRTSTSDSDTTGHSEESCTTTFSTSPSTEPYRGPSSPASNISNPAPHHQSQPIRIAVQGNVKEEDPLSDLRAQSAPEKPSTFKDIHRVGAFAQRQASDKNLDVEEVPFLSLLQQVKIDKTGKLEPGHLEVSKGTSSTKTDSSKADTSESGLSESKTSTSSQASAPEDFVMVELKTPFAGAESNSDLGRFYRECQSAPTLTNGDEDSQSVPETIEKLTCQLDVFETNMKDFDEFVGTLGSESDAESIGAPEKPSTFKDIHRVGAFAQRQASDKNLDVEEVPFLSLLQQVKIDKTGKLEPGHLEVSKGTSSTKTDSSKADTSESGLSESKTSTSSQASAPEDFVMVELKTPFAGAESNSDLGRFYRECQSAPTLTNGDEDSQSVPETIEKLTCQLDVFETNMKDFDEFVGTLGSESDAESIGSVSIGFEPSVTKMAET